MSGKSRPTIAIVDDEQSILALLRSLLVQADFHVETFADGQSAYSGFQEKKPDLILLDVSMPGLSGLDVCKQIRENLGDLVTPIVIMTGNDDFHSIEAAFRSGATDFFPKPLNFPLLIQRIRYALRNVKAWEMTANYQNFMLQSEKMSSLGQLAAGIAHEINNPVGYVLSNVQMLSVNLPRLTNYLIRMQTIATSTSPTEERIADARAADADLRLARLVDDLPSIVGDIETGIDRIGEIVKSLKVYAHPEEDKLVRTDFKELLLSIEKLLMGNVKNRVSLQLELPEESVHVMAISPKLVQVFINLVMNAVQSIKHDQGRVLVKLHRVGAYAQVDVTDNGSGIAPTELTRIFDPFYTTKEVGEGTGLGLSVSKAIVEKHGGHLSVQSQLGEGSLFRVSLLHVS
ncbi:response regulator [Salinispirillum sp. LH 10-3-1]|uniref:histidine kinase n=1 Tax=Salinispirillum sp. LH 10-3-1 TaxID=2952525 RepID=A0AB38YHQ4_9GAMM